MLERPPRWKRWKDCCSQHKGRVLLILLIIIVLIIAILIIKEHAELTGQVVREGNDVYADDAIKIEKTSNADVHVTSTT
jgi:hypothetical protein